MDGYQFLASILQSIVSLAWPMAFVVAVWLFRERLMMLLPFLRLKYKDFDVSFRIEQAEKEAAALPAPEPAPVTEPTPEEKDKFDRIAELSPRAAVLEVRGEIEEAIMQYASRYLRVTGTSPQNLLQTTRLLRSHGMIDASTSALLDDLRAIGNAAAHNRDVELTTEDAKRVRILANNLINRLQLAELKQLRKREEGE